MVANNHTITEPMHIEEMSHSSAALVLKYCLGLKPQNPRKRKPFQLVSRIHTQICKCLAGSIPLKCDWCQQHNGYLAHGPSPNTSSAISSGSSIGRPNSDVVSSRPWPKRTAESNAQIHHAGYLLERNTTATMAGSGSWLNTEERKSQREKRLDKADVKEDRPRAILALKDLCGPEKPII